MAVRHVIVSDISGTDVDEDEHARIVVTDHPSLRGSPVELDVSVAEAERFQTSRIDLVTMEIVGPGRPKRHVAIDAAAFAALFPDVDLDAVIEQARKVPASSAAAARRPRAAGRAERIDYASPEHAGRLHRGRVTEAEAAYVREHLDAVNARLAADGERVIDPADPKEKARYGF